MEAICESLKKQTNVEIIWVIYMPNKLKTPFSKSGEKILDIHDYTNALEILKQEKPDVIHAWATHNFIDYAFSLAGKKMNIPVVSGFSRTLAQGSSTFQTNLGLLLENSVPTDTIEKKQFMKRGRFFFFKYGFLLKTQIAIKMKKFEIIKDIFILMKIYLSNSGLPIYSKFENSLHWITGEDLIPSLTNAGFDKSKLVLTGHPMYDKIITKINLWETPQKTDNKIHVLFAPGTLAEHGFAKKTDQYEIIKKIVTTLTKDKNIKLTIKIHPSSAILSEYEKLVKPIDHNVPIFQKGDFLDYLHDSDVLVSFSATGALAEALIAKKPVIIVDFESVLTDDIIKRGLALECNNIPSLPKMINDILSSNPASEEKLQKFISDIFYKLDGKSSERISNEILKLLKL
jgi:UDP-N-acetylglucosamine:LPS N-acetylglucosamine transferase